jgi:hypothetical protein
MVIANSRRLVINLVTMRAHLPRYNNMPLQTGLPWCSYSGILSNIDAYIPVSTLGSPRTGGRSRARQLAGKYMMLWTELQKANA